MEDFSNILGPPSALTITKPTNNDSRGWQRRVLGAQVAAIWACVFLCIFGRPQALHSWVHHLSLGLCRQRCLSHIQTHTDKSLLHFIPCWDFDSHFLMHQPTCFYARVLLTAFADIPVFITSDASGCDRFPVFVSVILAEHFHLNPAQSHWNSQSAHFLLND